jgi:sporulation protein YlmC with PRC-barrel domain
MSNVYNKIQGRTINQFYGGITMKKITMLLMAILAVALFTGPSLAGETNLESNAYTADQLIGLNVNSLEGKHVGKIRDFNLNARTGKINYVILGKSLLGIGEDKFAVPLEVLKIQNDKGSVSATLIVSETRLLTAPSIAVGESDEEFRGNLLDYYCEAPEFEKGIDGPKRC